MTYCSRLAVAAARVAAAGIILQAAWAQLPSGTLRDWGNNTSGQLGNGTYTSSSLPIAIAGLGDVVSVSTGSMHGLAAKADGTVWAWGDNFFGELGNGTNTNSAVPVQVTGLTGVVRVSAGVVFSMALKSDGTVWTWGLNQDGALGNGTRVSSNTPVQVCCLLDHVVEIAAGGDFGLAMKSDGTVWSWGYNYDGELGIGTSGPNANYGVATLITNGYNASHIAASGTHAAMLKRDGTVWGWGYNQFGQVGDGTTTSRSVPVLVSGLGGISDIAAGAIHTLAMKPDGTVWAWGNTSGYAGGPVPMQVNIDHVVSIAGGFSHSLALKSDGTVWAWGINSYGELGNGDTMQVFDPIMVKNLAGVVALAKTSETSSMAISRQVPFAAADAKLTISTGLHAGFTLTENVTLGAGSNGINPPNEVFILEVGTYQVIIPPGSFKVSSNGRYAYSGTINNVKLDVQINPTSGNTFTVKASANDVWLGNLTNPVTVGLIVGGDLGTIITTANFN